MLVVKFCLPFMCPVLSDIILATLLSFFGCSWATMSHGLHQSIIKKEGVVTTAKKVHFDTVMATSVKKGNRKLSLGSPRTGKRKKRALDSVLGDLEKLPESKKPASSTSSLARPELEKSSESKKPASSTSSAARPEPEEYEVEAILDHKQVCSVYRQQRM